MSQTTSTGDMAPARKIYELARSAVPNVQQEDVIRQPDIEAQRNRAARPS